MRVRRVLFLLALWVTTIVLVFASGRLDVAVLGAGWVVLTITIAMEGKRRA